MIIFFPGVYPEFDVMSSEGRGVFLVILISAFILFNLGVIVYDLVTKWALPVFRRRQNIIEFRVKNRHAKVLIN